MKTLLLAPLFLVGVMASAQARLGENVPDLIARYGEPLPDGKSGSADKMSNTPKFQRNGFEIDVTLLDGVSASESFKKVNGDPFTSEEVQTLLGDNSGGRTWQAPQMVKGETHWLRDDGSMASLSNGRVLKLTSIDLISAKTQARQLEAAPSLQGF